MNTLLQNPDLSSYIITDTHSLQLDILNITIQN